METIIGIKLILTLFLLLPVVCVESAEQDLLVISAPTRPLLEDSALTRSARHLGFNFHTLDYSLAGEDDVCRQKCSDVQRLSSWLQKVSNAIILYLPHHASVLTTSPDQLLKKYRQTDSRILIGLSPHCSQVTGADCVDVRGFIAASDTLTELLRAGSGHTSLNQLIQQAYLNSTLKEKFSVDVDRNRRVFYQLPSGFSDSELIRTGGRSYVLVNNSDTQPADTQPTDTQPTYTQTSEASVVLANTKTMESFKHVTNYVGGGWSVEDGCLHCHVTPLDSTQSSSWPVVMVTVFIHQPTLFLREFFDRLLAVDYPRDRIHLLVNNMKYCHFFDVARVQEQLDARFSSVKLIQPGQADSPLHSTVANLLKEKKADYLLYLDSSTHLDHPEVLTSLIQHNRPFVSPLVARPGMAWSNFWGAVSDKGFYARSEDYYDILNQQYKGLWSVPHINSVMLMKKELIEAYPGVLGQEIGTEGYGIALSAYLREQEVDMWLLNTEKLGHLVNSDNYRTDAYIPEMYSVMDNAQDWEARYLHPNYSSTFKKEFKDIEMPCPDVYWFPLVSDEFCESLIKIMENFNGWSSGGHEDERLDGGYENVPTRDVHMKQIGMEAEWLYFLKQYVKPLQQKVFWRYYEEGGPKAYMNFVVRYAEGEQTYLPPHHDASTYTLNLALNRRGIDYQGGGVRFLRYDCALHQTRRGWTVLFPGRLTHLHEGMELISGKRYIMVSFIDP